MFSKWKLRVLVNLNILTWACCSSFPPAISSWFWSAVNFCWALFNVWRFTSFCNEDYIAYVSLRSQQALVSTFITNKNQRQHPYTSSKINFREFKIIVELKTNPKQQQFNSLRETKSNLHYWQALHRGNYV